MVDQSFNSKIRIATIEDAPILALAERKIAEIPGRLAFSPDEIKDDAFIEKISILNKGSSGKYIVIEVNKKIVGHAFLAPLKPATAAHVVDLTLAVHEEYQGKGYGKALLAYLIEWAKSNPEIEKIRLHVRSSNLNAILLYKKFGFVVEGVSVKFIKLSSDSYLDNIAMALWVGP